MFAVKEEREIPVPVRQYGVAVIPKRYSPLGRPPSRHTGPNAAEEQDEAGG